MRSHRKRDSEVEKEISRFLDETVYPKIGAEVERLTDQYNQLRGIDLLFTYKDIFKAKVDEKALTHYINKDLPTFAFELSSVQGDVTREGWFTNEKLETDFYMLIWLWANEEWDLKRENITKVQLYLVNKQDLLDYLESNGLSILDLRRKANEIRLNAVDGPLEKESYKDFYFYLSKNLSEEPVNIVFRKELLARLATYKFIGPTNN